MRKKPHLNAESVGGLEYQAVLTLSSEIGSNDIEGPGAEFEESVRFDPTFAYVGAYRIELAGGMLCEGGSMNGR